MAPLDKPDGPDRDRNSAFKTGHAKRGGRKAGTSNTVPRALVLEAAAEVGSDGRGKDGLIGYFKYLGVSYPCSFFQGLIKLMEIQGLEQELHELQSRIQAEEHR